MKPMPHNATENDWMELLRNQSIIGNDPLMELLAHVVYQYERNTCDHDERHRAGAIWEICDDCGAKWADDRGGKPPVTVPRWVKIAQDATNGVREGKVGTL